MEVSGKTINEIDSEKEKDSLKKIEAGLFISGRVLTIQELITYTDLNPIILRELLEKLKEKYIETDSALELIPKA